MGPGGVVVGGTVRGGYWMPIPSNLGRGPAIGSVSGAFGNNSGAEAHHSARALVGDARHSAPDR